MTTGYCVKCRKKHEIKNEEKVKIHGRNAVKGICPVCRTKMFRFT